MSVLRVVTLPGDPEAEATVAGALNGRSDVEVLMRCMDRIELLAALRGGGIDAVVSIGLPAWFDAQAAEEATANDVRVVGVVADPLEADRLAAMGAALVPVGAPVAELIGRCRSRAPAPPVPTSASRGPHGALIAVWGPKGAPGRTSVAIELAFELASHDPAVLLIDGDPYGGDVIQALGVVEELPTIVWAARAAARNELDAGRLSVELRRAANRGPALLPGLPRGELWADVSEFGWKRLLEMSRAAFVRVVCDVGFCLEPPSASDPGRGRNAIARAAISSASRVVAVCRADPIGIKSFLWGFESLRGLVDLDNVVVVANRVRPGTERETGDTLRRYTGRRPVCYLPDEPAKFRRAALEGRALKTIASGSDFCSAVEALAAALGSRVAPGGFLARLGGRA